MNSTREKCLLAYKCKKAGDVGQCNRLCFPFTKLQGETGTGGLWGLAEIPATYGFLMAGELPFKEANPAAFEIISRYCKHVLDYVQGQNMGLYLYSIPNPDNPKGTGTGKTTAAVAVLNEYLVARVIQHVKKEKAIDAIPALFVSVPRFQNVFNKQFRGPKEVQEEASLKYYLWKERIMAAELLVLDDTGIRESTQAFSGEFYELIDERAVEERATILTSNEPLATIATIYDERTASRIEGFTVPVKFFGKDNRKGWQHD